MPKYKTVYPYYNPVEFTEKSDAAYRQAITSPEYVEAFGNYKREIIAIQPDLRQHLTLLVNKLRSQSKDLADIIYGEDVIPAIEALINQLSPLTKLANPAPIIPEQVELILNKFIDEILQTIAKDGPTLKALNSHINSYKSTITQLTTTANEAKEVCIQLKNKKFPKEVTTDNLLKALNSALDKIADEARDQIAQTEAEESAVDGIPTFCACIKDKLKDGRTFKSNEEINTLFKDIINREYKHYFRDKKTEDFYKIVKMIGGIVLAHNENLLSLQIQAPKPTSILTILDSYLERRRNVKENNQTKQYYGFFTCFEKSFSQKEAAVTALKHALDGRPEPNLLKHLSTLRDGELGKSLRDFIKAGHADHIVGKNVNTVSDFIKELDKLVNSEKEPSPQFSNM